MGNCISLNMVRVDHRYQTAINCLERGKHLSPGQTDAHTLAVYRHIKLRPAPRLGGGQQHLNVDLTRAMQIYEDREALLRHKLEAFLLTPLSPAEIGERLLLSPRVVEMYAAMFYDVRAALQANRAMALEAILAQCCSADAENLEHAFAWKMAAASSVRELERAIGREDGGKSLTAALALWLQQAQTVCVAKLKAAVQNAHADAPDAIRQLRKISEAIRAAQPEGEHEALLEQIDNLFKSIRFAVNPHPDTAHPGLLPFDQSSVELNMNEVLLVGCGRPLPNQDALLRETFPDPPVAPIDQDMSQFVPGLSSPGTARRERAKLAKLKKKPPALPALPIPQIPDTADAPVPYRKLRRAQFAQQLIVRRKRKHLAEIRAARSDASAKIIVAYGKTNAGLDKDFDDRLAEIPDSDATALAQLEEDFNRRFPKYQRYELREQLGLTIKPPTKSNRRRP